MDAKPAPADANQEFAWKVHQYTNEYIRFADQKAGIVLAVETGLLAAAYAAKLHQACWPSRLTVSEATLYDTTVGVLSWLAFAGLGLGAIFALWAVAPRLHTDLFGWLLSSRWVRKLRVCVLRSRDYRGLKRRASRLPHTHRLLRFRVLPRRRPPKPGAIFWEQVLATRSASGYTTQLVSMSPADRVEAVSEHIFDLAAVADAKYTNIRRSMLFGTAGAFFAVFALVIG